MSVFRGNDWFYDLVLLPSLVGLGAGWLLGGPRGSLVGGAVGASAFPAYALVRTIATTVPGGA